MTKPEMNAKQLESALFQFIFPFSFKTEGHTEIGSIVTEEGFARFHLSDLELERRYYGDGYRVSHQKLERYFLPFTNNVLFPHTPDPKAFQRYSKVIDDDCELITSNHKIPFKIWSVDILACPFQVGFITIRTELAGGPVDFSTAVEFASRFRVLQDITEQDNLTYISCDGFLYKEVEKFIFKKLAPCILSVLDKSGMKGAYFETLPFFADERMYVEAYFGYSEAADITTVDLYRAVQLDGMDLAGKPFVSANNIEFIQKYCDKHTYSRWAPNTYFAANEQAFMCLTNEGGVKGRQLANQMYGEYYYGLMLNLFHKIVLLKLSNEYSQVDLVKDNDEINDLITLITEFSSKYFFLELVSQSPGKDIFLLLRSTFGNDMLYVDVKQTLTDLFQYRDSFSSRRQNYLLLILTLYTVVGGIFGMNLVITDLKGSWVWSKMADYSVFEYVALFITLSGLVVGTLLALNVGANWLREVRKKRA